MFAYLMILVQTRDTCPRPSGKRIWRSEIVICQRAYNLYLRVRITPMINCFGEVKKLKCMTYICTTLYGSSFIVKHICSNRDRMCCNDARY